MTDDGQTNFCPECKQLADRVAELEALLAEVGRVRRSVDGIDATVPTELVDRCEAAGRGEEIPK